MRGQDLVIMMFKFVIFVESTYRLAQQNPCSSFRVQDLLQQVMVRPALLVRYILNMKNDTSFDLPYWQRNCGKYKYT